MIFSSKITNDRKQFWYTEKQIENIEYLNFSSTKFQPIPTFSTTWFSIHKEPKSKQ